MASRWQCLLQTLKLRFTGWVRIPLLGSVRPSVLELDEDHCVVRVRLRRWTRNHLGSMYFGALAIGSDGAGGTLATYHIRRRGAPVALIFKSFHAEFLRRAEADVYFICRDGAAIAALLDRALATGARQTGTLRLQGAVAEAGGYRDVASFTLELSLKPLGPPAR